MKVHKYFQEYSLISGVRRIRKINPNGDANLKYTTRVEGDSFLDLKTFLNFT